MRKAICAYSNGVVSIGREMARQGFLGKCDGYPNAVTLTIVKPGANLDEAIQSLKLTIQDLELRKAHGERISKIRDRKLESRGGDGETARGCVSG